MVGGETRLQDGRPGNGTGEAVDEAAILETADRVARETLGRADALSLTEPRPKTWNNVRY